MTEHEAHRHHGVTYENYLMGFAISVLLTLVAFSLAFLHLNTDHEFLSHDFLVKTIIVLAIAQLFVQAVFFLHLSRRPEGRFNLTAFIFTIYTVAFIAIGSIWIMGHLNYNMTPNQIDKYMHNQN